MHANFFFFLIGEGFDILTKTWVLCNGLISNGAKKITENFKVWRRQIIEKYEDSKLKKALYKLR